MRAPLFRKTWSPRLLATLALVGAWVVFFAHALFSDSVTFYRDHLLTYLPLEQYIHTRFLQGELPQWYPMEGLGVPLIGQIATGIFHPLTWVLLVLPPFVAVKWKLLLSYLIAEVGAYRFAREVGGSRPASVAAAFSFGFGGYLLGVSSTVPYVLSVGMLGFIGWSGARIVRHGRVTDAVLLGLWMALVFLSGDPQTLLLSTVLLFILWCARPNARSVGLFALSGILGGLLSCVELLPAQRCFAESVRVRGHVSSIIDTFWALPPLRLVELLVPGFVPDEVRESALHGLMGAGDSSFVTTIFAGGIVLFLAAAGAWKGRRRTVGFVLFAAVAVWFATGGWGGLLPWLRRAIPVFTRFRFPEKYLVFLWASLIPLVALGLDEVLRSSRRWARVAAGAALVLGLFALGCATLEPSRHLWRGGVAAPASPAVWRVLDRSWTEGLLWTALFLALAAALLFLPEGSRLRRGPLLAGLVFLELWHGNRAHLPVVPRASIAPTNAFADVVRSASEGRGAPAPRVFAEAPYHREAVTEGDHELWVRQTLDGLFPDSAALYGVNSVTPRLGGFSVRYATFIGASGENARRWGPLVNVCFHEVPSRDNREIGKPAFSNGELSLFRIPCLPRAYLVGAEPVPNLDAAGAWLSRARPPLLSVPWEGGPAVAPARGQVHWVSAKPEELVLEVKASSAAALIVGDEYAEGWTASLDGAPTPIHPALLDVRGVSVPAGQHRVVFAYKTPGLRAGFALTLLGLLLGAGLIFSDARTRRGPGPGWKRP